MVLDEHDVVNGLLDGEGRARLVGLDVARARHDLRQAVVEAVQVAAEVATLDLPVFLGHLFLLVFLAWAQIKEFISIMDPVKSPF